MQIATNSRKTVFTSLTIFMKMPQHYREPLCRICTARRKNFEKFILTYENKTC